MNDPEEIKRVEKQIMLNIDSVNRWTGNSVIFSILFFIFLIKTDNTYAIKSYLTKKKGMSGKDVSIIHPNNHKLNIINIIRYQKC